MGIEHLEPWQYRARLHLDFGADNDMKIHILSDLHNEFLGYQPDASVQADVVVLAGDIDLGVSCPNWARQAFSCPVLYVPGNHEYYGGHLSETRDAIFAAAGGNFHVLEMTGIEIEGIRFLGTTAWTDYSATGNRPLAEWDARNSMTDFDRIKTCQGRGVVPEDFVELNGRARHWLEQQLATPFDGPTVVVTHHAPSVASLGHYANSPDHLNAAFANRWEDMMGDQVALWIHGHTHVAVDYEMAGTRIVCNPRGYRGENTGFDPRMIVTVG